MLSSRTQVFLSFYLAILGLTVWLPVGQPGQPQAYGQSGENLVEGKGCCLEVSLRKPFQEHALLLHRLPHLADQTGHMSVPAPITCTGSETILETVLATWRWGLVPSFWDSQGWGMFGPKAIISPVKSFGLALSRH